MARFAKWAACVSISALFGPLCNSALGSTVTVPDETPSIQVAIDSGADTVVVREGTYAERLVIEHPVVLHGTGAQRPRLTGIHVYNTNFWPALRELSVKGIDFAGVIFYQTVAVHPRLLTLTFSECSLDSGLFVANWDTTDLFAINLRNCRLGANSFGQAEQVTMEADTIDGGIRWTVEYGAYVRDCWFRGGPNRGLELTGYPRGEVVRNRFEDYRTGLFVSSSEDFRIQENTFLRCDTGVQLRNVSEATVTNNAVRNCNVGVDIAFCDGLIFRENTVVDTDSTGVSLSSVGGNWGLVAERNVIGKCGGSGLAVSYPYGNEQITSNTVFDCGGDGMTLAQTSDYTITVQGNVAVRNKGWGLAVPSSPRLTLGCNDWFANGAGLVGGAEPGPTDLSIDPLFCALDSADVSLHASSPLNDVACGQIGALGIGCGTVKMRAWPMPRPRPLGIEPNPGIGPVRIAFALDRVGPAEIAVFDMLGRRIASVVRGVWSAGTHRIVWDGLTGDGQPAPSGMYFARLTYPGGYDQRAFVRLR